MDLKKMKIGENMTLAKTDGGTIYGFKHGNIKFDLSGVANTEATINPGTMHEVLEAMEKILKIKFDR
jgi:hypothetical protein